MPTTVTEQIKILLELQKIDSEIHRLKKEWAMHPERQKRAEQEFEKKKAGLKATEDELKAVQLKQKQRESDLAAREDKIAKLQAQLYQLKSNKEYSTMELEIKGMKADKSLLEEEILGLMDSLEQIRGRAAKEKELLSGEEKRCQETLEALKREASALEASVKELNEKRKHFTPNVEPRLLSQYERLLRGLDGLALVPVVNNSCGGCHIGLPPQVVNETQQSEKWVLCESCARLLYWPL